MAHQPEAGRPPQAGRGLAKSTTTPVFSLRTDKRLKMGFTGHKADNYAKYAATQMAPCTWNMLPALQLHSAKSVLECAVGSGHATPCLLQLLPSGARYVATDYSEEMLAKLRNQDWFKKGFEGVEITSQQADIRGMPFEDGQFDRFLASMLLMSRLANVDTLSEVHRVLAPGGIAAFSTFGIPGGEVCFHPMQISDPRIKTVIAKYTKPRKPKVVDRPDLFQADSKPVENREWAHSLFIEAGFESVVSWFGSVPFTYDLAAAHADDNPECFIDGQESKAQMLKELHELEKTIRASGDPELLPIFYIVAYKAG